MTNSIQFFNKLDINNNIENTIQNIDDLGLKLLDINKIIEPNLIDEYKILNSYKSYLIKHLSLIDFIMNNKDKYQNYINNLLNTILNSKKSFKFKDIKDILVDNIYKFNYEQYGGIVLEDNMDGDILYIKDDGTYEIKQDSTYEKFLKNLEDNITKFIETKSNKYNNIIDNINVQIDELESMLNDITENNTKKQSHLSIKISDSQNKITKLMSDINKYHIYANNEQKQLSTILSDTSERIIKIKKNLNKLKSKEVVKDR